MNIIADCRQDIEQLLKKAENEFKIVINELRMKYDEVASEGKHALENPWERFERSQEVISSAIVTFRKVRFILQNRKETDSCISELVRQKDDRQETPAVVKSTPALLNEHCVTDEHQAKFQRTAQWAAEHGFRRDKSESSESDSEDYQVQIDAYNQNRLATLKSVRPPNAPSVFSQLKSSKILAVSQECSSPKESQSLVSSEQVQSTPGRKPRTIPNAVKVARATAKAEQPASINGSTVKPSVVSQAVNNVLIPQITNEPSTNCISTIIKPTARYTIPPPLVPPLKDPLKVVVSDCASLTSFYVQTLIGTDFVRYCAELNERYLDAKPVTTMPPANAFCVTKFSLDSRFYRAKVLSVSGDEAVVQYIDYGNCEQVTMGDIYELDDISRLLPAKGVKCHIREIPGVPSFSEKCNEFVIDAFMEHVMQNPQVTMVFLKSKESADGLSYEVDFPLEDDGLEGKKYLSEVLGEIQYQTECDQVEAVAEPSPWYPDGSLENTEKIPPPEPLPEVTDIRAVFTNINDPSASHIRLVNDAEEYVKFEQEFNEACVMEAAKQNKVQLHKIGIGSFYAARYEGVWARVKILNVFHLKKSVKVLSVDYGNDFEVGEDDLCRLSEPFHEKPAFCHKIRLHGIEPINSAWCQKSLAFFKNKVTLCQEYLVNSKKFKKKSEDFFGTNSVILVDSELRIVNDMMCRNQHARQVSS